MINTGNDLPPAAGIRSAPTRAQPLPLGFLATCVMAFGAAIAGMVYFCRTMSGGMVMPGGWTMSMMWMRMPGQSWFVSGVLFLLMWLAMMVAMMLPSALPMLMNCRPKLAEGGAGKNGTPMMHAAAGYFAVWLIAGAGLYPVSIAFASAAMRWDALSRAVPVLSAGALIAAGVSQFTRWKMTSLLRCRSPFGCVISCPERDTGFRLGCKQGLACCVCCAAPMLMLLALGMMNPLVIVGVAVVIVVEKLLPRPDIVARCVGIVAMAVGISLLTRMPVSQ